MNFLNPWYSKAERERRRFEATRPDILSRSDYVGMSVPELSILHEEGEIEARARIDRMLDACRTDWPRYLCVTGDINVSWIEAFDEYYDRSRIAGIIRDSDPADFSNDYLVLVCEFGAALGHVLRAKQPRLAWLYDSPYWESSLVDPQSGSVIPPFHWAIKKLSEYGVDDGFAAKMDLCLHVLDEEKRLITNQCQP